MAAVGCGSVTHWPRCVNNVARSISMDRAWPNR